jgi:phage shock protein C
MAKKLTKGQKKIFGVCSGLADYFDIDETVMRLIFIVAFFGFGTGLLVYIVLAIVMPNQQTAIEDRQTINGKP